MSSGTCKLEQDLCRCCHSEGCFKNLAEPFKSANFEEIYADMLKECYNIDMAPVPGMLSSATYTICEVCIIRLRDASEFKKQVLLCEERFNDIYNRIGVKEAVTTIDIDVEIKQEIPELVSDDVLKDDLPADSEDDFPLDDKHDDYDLSEDLTINEEREADENPVKVQVRKKRKYKKKTVKTNSVKSKRKKESNHNTEPADENDAEKKTDPGERPRYLKDVDYKQIGDLYQCTRCDKKHSEISSMKSHLRYHQNHMEHKCSYCIEVFRTHRLLTMHKLEVHNVDHRVACGLCDKKFILEMQLKRHMTRVHLLGETGRRYKCELCDFVSMTTVGLYRHKFNHKTELDQHCSFCSKSFKRRATMLLHERIHTGERRSACTECGQAFVQKASLNYHMTKYHPEVKF